MADLNCYSDVNPPSTDSRTCECGNPRLNRAKTCERCRFLDGERPIQSAIIGALRNVDGLTINELAASIYGRVTPVTTITLRRSTKALIDLGRLKRYQRENDAVPIMTRGRHGLQRMNTGGGESWVYVLVSGKEAANDER